ncbi:hypothetical protein H5410_041635 [Solanum commersonii]|uniref:Uncharacterized protein n=1 Tax=Solanum commersonii TaxID=4109 RepID=A0A9J5XSF8_SOLCO|nr:hypothetical protein H5410_041635 [Solanum commersonii]
MIPACVWWTIWRERNDRCFENRDNNLQEVKLKCILLFCFWCTNVYSNDTESIIDCKKKKKKMMHISSMSRKVMEWIYQCLREASEEKKEKRR